MNGKGDDSRSELDDRIDAHRAEFKKFQDELLDHRDDLHRDLQDWTDDDGSRPLRGPFERFKGFVDNNLGILSDGFRHFPSIVSELKATMQAERGASKEEERDIYRRWTGCDDSPDHVRMQVDRASPEKREAAKDATYMLLRESFERNKHVSPMKILELYHDDEWKFGGLDVFANPRLSFGGACYYKPETLENLPSTARWGWTSPAPQWLSVDWFKRSPYSPIRCEDLTKSGGDTKWRAAFEDLLCTALDKPMGSEERVGQRIPYGKPQSTYHGPGLDWMLSLQCRGILPPQLPSLYRPGVSVSVLDESDGLAKVCYPAFEASWQNFDSVTASRSGNMGSQVDKEFNILIDEVAIQSGPETQAKPLPLKVTQTPWQVPETEQDLYDQMPPLIVPEGPWVPTMTGDWESDLDQADQALAEAAQYGDVDTAKRCIEAFYRAHGDLDDLIQEQYDNALHDTTLNEALRQADVPLSDYWKRSACQTTKVKDELMTGNRDADFEAADEALWDAASDSDVHTAMRYVDAFYRAHGDVSQLVQMHVDQMERYVDGPGHTWLQFLNEYLRNSNLPVGEVWRLSALQNRLIPRMTGGRHADQDAMSRSLWGAIIAKDVTTAAECLSKFYDEYREVTDLVWHSMEYQYKHNSDRWPAAFWVPLLNEALIRSRLPETDLWKRFACNPDMTYLAEAAQRSPEETRRERQLMARGDRVVGEAVVWPLNWSLDELEQRVVELEGLDRPRQQNTFKHTAASKEESSTKRPDILSQLTTTHTTRLPDGTVTTKVVLKQRFADGREETQESEQTTHEQREMDQRDQKKLGEALPAKGGWFWSRDIND